MKVKTLECKNQRKRLKVQKVHQTLERRVHIKYIPYLIERSLGVYIYIVFNVLKKNIYIIKQQFIFNFESW